MTEKDEPVVNGYLLDESVTLTTHELGEACAVEVRQIIQLVDEGILEPVAEEDARWRFSAENLHRAHKALRLQRDLEINLAGVAVVLDLLDEIDQLRARLRYLEQKY